jgi:hypothetical protein
VVLVVADGFGLGGRVSVVLVVVTGGGHAAPPHASQQLGMSLTQAEPPRGGLQARALGLMLHRWTPAALV